MTKFHHFRNLKEDGSVYNMGGLTVAWEVNEQNKSIRYAFAICSDRDNFNKKVGRTIAGGRLKSPNHSFVVYDVTEEEFLNSFTYED